MSHIESTFANGVGTRNTANFAGTEKFCFRMKEDKWNKFFCEVAIAG
jgi:hypothetical protein